MVNGDLLKSSDQQRMQEEGQRCYFVVDKVGQFGMHQELISQSEKASPIQNGKRY